MIRRCAVARIGGFEASFRGMFEDQVLFMKLSAESCVYVASRTWAHYRQRADSCSARSEASGEVREAKLRLLHWLEAYLRVRKLHSQQVWQMLRKQQRAARWPVLQAIHSRYAGLKRLLS